MKHKSKKYFEDGYSCSEAILKAAIDEELISEHILPVATAFSGGMSSGCLCGAVAACQIIIGATNKYDILDPAVKRRFDSKVFVDIPDEKSIKALLEKNLKPLKKGQKLLSSPEDLETISRLLKGFSNSSICTISKEAALNAMRRDRADIAVEDYKKAIETTGEEKPDRKLYLAESKKSSNKIGFSANN